MGTCRRLSGRFFGLRPLWFESVHIVSVGVVRVTFTVIYRLYAGYDHDI